MPGCNASHEPSHIRRCHESRDVQYSVSERADRTTGGHLVGRYQDGGRARARSRGQAKTSHRAPSEGRTNSPCHRPGHPPSPIIRRLRGSSVCTYPPSCSHRYGQCLSFDDGIVISSALPPIYAPRVTSSMRSFSNLRKYERS
jgi:hypothetical protein